MDKALYIASSGATQMMQAQAVHANNLANAQTTGFKSDLAFYSSHQIAGDGLASRAYAQAENSVANFAPGAIVSTGRSLDVAVDGPGFMVAQTSDGTSGLTRNGGLMVSPEGLLVNGDNHLIMGEGGPIFIPPADEISIAQDGTLSIIPLGSNTSVALDRLNLVQPDLANLEKNAQGLFVARDGQDFVPSPDVKVVSGALEHSNVSSVGEMVHMIDLARQFEVQVKLMRAAEENDKAAADIINFT